MDIEFLKIYCLKKHVFSTKIMLQIFNAFFWQADLTPASSWYKLLENQIQQFLNLELILL